MIRCATAVCMMLMCATHLFADERVDAARKDAAPLTQPALTSESLKRPAVLPALYTSLVALQIYDGLTTVSGLTFGAREANPAMQWMSASPMRVWSVKAATTTLALVAGEQMWRRHKTAAIVTMAVVNGMAVAVAARNTSVLRQIR